MWNFIKKEQDALIQKINNLSLEEKINLVHEIVEDPVINRVYNCAVELDEIKSSLLGRKLGNEARYFEPVQFSLDDFIKAAKSITAKEKVMQKNASDGIDHYPRIGTMVVRFYSSYLLAEKHVNNMIQKIKAECPTLCGIEKA